MDFHDLELLQNIDLYNILNIPDKLNINKDIIKKNYKKLVLKFHPDRIQTCETREQFDLIQLAYVILSNEEYKNKYDEMYELNSNLKDFSSLKKNFSLEHILSIDEDEFKQKIKQMNKHDVELEMILDREKSIEKINQLLQDRKNQDELIPKLNESLFNKESFNDEFESSIIDIQDSDTEIINYERKIEKFGSLDNYNTMYSDQNEYNEYFKINKIKSIIDDKTLDDKINEYIQETEILKNLTKFKK
jgi:hypothetical protein